MGTKKKSLTANYSNKLMYIHFSKNIFLKLLEKVRKQADTKAAYNEL